MAMFTLPLDIFYFSFKDKLSGQIKRWKERLKWKLMQPYISQVMTVSEYSRSELINSVGFPGEKIKAVWNGLDHEKFKPSTDKNNTEPYFLTVISYQKKKNFERLIKAYKLLDENTRPRLAALVKPYEQKEKIKGLEIINFNVSEEKIIEYYQHALGLVFVSLHEGFGLPIVEAMACGIPVVTSDTTSCKEIAGDAAVLVNPTSIDEISAAMKRIAADELLRQELSGKGMERAKLFDWSVTAQKFYELLEKAVK